MNLNNSFHKRLTGLGLATTFFVALAAIAAPAASALPSATEAVGVGHDVYHPWLRYVFVTCEMQQQRINEFGVNYGVPIPNPNGPFPLWDGTVYVLERGCNLVYPQTHAASEAAFSVAADVDDAAGPVVALVDETAPAAAALAPAGGAAGAAYDLHHPWVVRIVFFSCELQQEIINNGGWQNPLPLPGVVFLFEKDCDLYYDALSAAVPVLR